MTAYAGSASHLTRCTLSVAVIAMLAVAGSVWANGNGQQASIAPGTGGVDVAALLSNTEIANLPALNIIEQAF